MVIYRYQYIKKNLNLIYNKKLKKVKNGPLTEALYLRETITRPEDLKFREPTKNLG